MSKKLLLGGVALLALLFSITLYGSSAQKIGILDTAALEESAQFNNIRDKLSAEFKPAQEDLNKKQKVLEEKYQAMQKDKDMLSEKQITAKENELNKLQKEMQAVAEKAQSSYQARYQEELTLLQIALNKIIEELAQKEKYDLILAKNAAIFVSPKNEEAKNSFTKMVISRLDKEFKVSSNNDKENKNS